MKKFLHKPTGMTGQMLYEPRGDKALIGIVHCGEREEAIVSGPALTFAKVAYEARDVDGYIALWRVNLVQAQRIAA